MKKSLLFGLSALVTASAMAESPQAVVQSPLNIATTTIRTPAPVSRVLAPGKSLRVRSHAGKSVKRFSNTAPTRNVRPMRAKAPRRAEQGTGTLFQSFEDENFSDGWTTVSKVESTEQWGIADAESLQMLGITAPDGNQVAAINYVADFNDQWLVSPKFTPAAGEELSFWSFFGPAFFNSMDNIDWDKLEYTSDPVRTGDLEVLVSTDGENWNKIYSLMDQYAGLPLADLLNINDADYHVSLADYAGKEIQIAFRYQATDCNTIAIDAVKVAPPNLEDISYMEPMETHYYGFAPDADWSSLNLDLAFYPVFAPLTWTNTSGAEATYLWSYHNPATNDKDISMDTDLTAEYAPDYSSDFTRRNNLYYAPELQAFAESGAEGSYTRGYTYFQAGGKPEFEVTAPRSSEKEIKEFGLLPFIANVDGVSVVTVDDETIGDPAIPIFGYNANTDKYWLNYTMNGEEPEEGDDVRLTGIMNVIYPSSQPMVVSGAHVMGFGQLKEGAEFRLDIYTLSDDYEISDENIVATATCPYSKMLIAENGANDRINAVFTLDKPFILDNNATAYAFKFSGFNSDQVEYFVPLQQYKPDAFLCRGFIEKTMKVLSEEYRTSYTPIAYFENEFGEMYSAFAINIDGYYPYLTAETETIEHHGSEAYIMLGSYYDGADLTVTAPEGIEAKVEGRYDTCMLTVTCKDESKANGTLTLSAPGVEKTFYVTSSSVGVDEIGIEAGEVEAVFTPDGRRVNPAALDKGIYIFKYKNGQSRKAAVC